MRRLRWIAAAVAAAAGFSTAAQASSADWFMVAAQAPGSEAVTLAKGQSSDALVAFVPRRVLMASGPIVIAENGYAIPQGTLFVPVDGDGSGRVCAMARHLGSAFNCLKDSDGDGRFDTYFGQQVFNEFYFGSRFSEDSLTPLANSVALTELDPFTQIAPIKAKLTFAGGAPGKAMKFRLCLGEPSGAAAWPEGLYKDMCLTQAFAVDGTQPGAALDIFGLRFAVEAAGPKSVTLTSDPASRKAMTSFGGRSF